MSKSKIIKIVIIAGIVLLIALGIILTYKPEEEPIDKDENTPVTYVDYIVEIKGEVKYPGLYTVPSNAIVSDIVNLAGGFTINAYVEDLNLASKVTDGLSIYIRSKDENNQINKININTATSEQLKTLPGIADAKAQAIITYRNINGSFQKIEDIMAVNGISETIFNKIKDYITV